MDFQTIAEVPLGFDSSKSACRGKDVHLFFPNDDSKRSEGGVKRFHTEAKALCSSCEVQEPCLEYALKFEPLGIWGGTTEVEREFMRREKNIKLPPGRPMSDCARRAVRQGRGMKARYEQ